MTKETSPTPEMIREYLSVHFDKADKMLAESDGFTLQETAELQQGQIAVLRSAVESILDVLAEMRD